MEIGNFYSNALEFAINKQWSLPFGIGWVGWGIRQGSLKKTPLKLQNTNIIQTKYKIQNTKYKIQNTKYKIHNTKKIQNMKKVGFKCTFETHN